MHGLQKNNKLMHSAKVLRLLSTEVMAGKFIDGTIDNDRQVLLVEKLFKGRDIFFINIVIF